MAKVAQNFNHMAAGAKFIALDGGLDLKTDPFLMAQDGAGRGATTLANNVWYLTPGQVRALPPIQQGTYSDATAGGSVYHVFRRVATEPVTTGGIGAWQSSQDEVGMLSPYIAVGETLASPTPLPTGVVHPFQVRSRSLNSAGLPAKVSQGQTRFDSQSYSPITLQNELGGAGIQVVGPTVYPLDFAGNNILPGFLGGTLTAFPSTDPFSTTSFTQVDVIPNPTLAGSYYIAYRDTSNLIRVQYCLRGRISGASYTLPNTVSNTTQQWQLFSIGTSVYVARLDTPSSTFQAVLLNPGAAGTTTTLATGQTAGNLTAFVDSANSLVFVFNGAGIFPFSWNSGTFTAGGAVGGFSPLLAAAGTRSPTFLSLTGAAGVNGQKQGAVFQSSGAYIASPLSTPSQPISECQQVFTCVFTYTGNATTTPVVTIGLKRVFFVGTSGATLASQAFGLPASKGYGVLVRTGSVDKDTNAASQYAQPTYFIVDHRARAIARFYEGGAPADPTLGMTYSSATLAGMQTTLPRVQYLPTPNSASAYDLIISMWRNVVEGFLPGPFTVSQLNNADSSTGISLGSIGPPNIIEVQPSLTTITFPANLALSPTVQAGAAQLIAGGVVATLDGKQVVESGFHNAPHWPTKGATAATLAFTITTGGTTSVVISNASNTGLQPGMTIVQGGNTATITGILYNQDGTGVSSATSSVVQLTSATGAFTAGAATAFSNPAGTYLYRAIYRWTDAAGQLHRSAPSPVISVVQSSTWATQSINVPVPFGSDRGQTDAPISTELYRTDPSGTVFYLVGTAVTTQLGPNPITQTTLWRDIVTTVVDTQLTLSNPLSKASFPAYWQTHYKSDPPPSFIWQVMSQGRHFGLASVDGVYRVYFTNVWMPGFPVEWNVTGYVPVPPELGDCRSLAVLDDSIFVLANGGVGFFNGNGPGTAPGSNGIDLDVGVGFSSVVPIPNASGVLGSGCPVTMPDGIIYQGVQGFMMLNRSRDAVFVGDRIDNITGTYGQPSIVYGSGILLPRLQIVLFTNPSGDSLAFDYNQKKWSVWQGAVTGPIAGATQRQDGTLYLAQQPVSGATLPATYNTTNASGIPAGVSLLAGTGASLSPNSTFTLPTYSLETPWLQVGEAIGGEGNTWEVAVLGKYYSPHILRVETAVNFADYGSVDGYLQDVPVSSAPVPSYQFRFRSPGTTRIWAVRYRITVLPPSPANSTVAQDYARISGLMVFSGSIQGTTRVGYGVSK